MTDKEKIANGEWVNCYICEEVFKRQRKSKRYCHKCERAFCEGEHGTFQGGRVPVCLKCYTIKDTNDK
ncbi:MAG: hypothetical protein L3J41_07085 [Melioribacteraceae bacterium]|nr:hypothetical protein [Melioribacteraceae bacterium]